MYEDKVFLRILIASDFAFRSLPGNSEEGRKRHALALKKFQRARDKWKTQKVKKNKNHLMC